MASDATRVAGLSGTALKLIAVASMLVDHVGYLLCGNLYWMRAVGRLAFPLFAFLLVEGFLHTRSVGRYCLRLAVFAVLSEPCFDFSRTGGLWDPSYQNVFFTLLLGLLAIWGLDRLARLPGAICAGAAVWAAIWLRVDYDGLGVALMILLWLWRGRSWGRAAAVTLFAVLFVSRETGYVMEVWDILGKRALPYLIIATAQLWCLLDLPILARYNGQRGGEGLPRWSAMAFYAFYPLHLLALGAVVYLR